MQNACYYKTSKWVPSEIKGHNLVLEMIKQGLVKHWGNFQLYLEGIVCRGTFPSQKLRHFEKKEMPILGSILLVYIFLPWYWSNAHWISKDLIFRKWNANHSKHSTYSKCHTLCGGKLQVGNMPSEYTRIFCWCCYYKTTKKVHLQSKERIWCYNAIIQPFVNNKK